MRWTQGQIDSLVEGLEAGHPLKKIALQLDRTASAVQAKIKSLQLKNKKNSWSEEDLKNLEKLTAKYESFEAIGILLGRTPQAIKSKIEFVERTADARLPLDQDEATELTRLESLLKFYDNRNWLASVWAFLTRSNEDLSEIPELRLRKLASAGEDITVIASQLGVSDASVRSKLVYRGLYDQYLIQTHITLRNKLSKIEKKLGLTHQPESNAPDAMFVDELIQKGEGLHLEFKSTYRFSTKANLMDCPLVKNEVVKAICGFMNADGGTLLIGVKDNGVATGIFDDDLETPDQYIRHILRFIQDCLGKVASTLVDITIVRMPSNEEVCLVKAQKSKEAIWCTNPTYNTKKGWPKDHQIFYVRQPATTEQLSAKDAVKYCSQRFTD